MGNWTRDERDAMKGYVIYAAQQMFKDEIEDFTEVYLNEMLQKLNSATDSMTADEARRYYLNSEY